MATPCRCCSRMFSFHEQCRHELYVDYPKCIEHYRKELEGNFFPGIKVGRGAPISMNSLSNVVDTFFPVCCLAGGLLIVAVILYFTHRMNRLVSLTQEQRSAWVQSHFPEPEYTRESMDTAQFVAALLENLDDSAIWQYYDEFDEARKVEGGYDKLCSLDCCAKEDSAPGLLFIVTGNKVKIALDPYAVRVVLRIVLQYQKVSCWIQEQPQYAGFSLKTVSLKDMNAVLSAPGISLWRYVSAWEDIAFISPEKYDSINCATYYTLFAIDAEAKCIYRPLLKVAEDRE